jgi:hypothetical protein
MPKLWSFQKTTEVAETALDRSSEQKSQRAEDGVETGDDLENTMRQQSQRN